MSKRTTRESKYATSSMAKAQTTPDEPMKVSRREGAVDNRVQDVVNILKENGHGIYVVGDLEHGKRITTNTRLKICVYHSGKIVVQGNPEIKDDVVELLRQTYQDMVVRG